MKVVVLGAGVIGVSIADALARRGADVTVLDMRAPGRGASYASAGMLAPYAEGHGDVRFRDLLTRGLGLFDEYVHALAEDTRQPIEYARTGTLEVALDPDDAGRLERAKRELDLAGVSSELVAGPELSACEPAVNPKAALGLLTHVHGFVGVHALVSALVTRAKFAGAVFESPIEARNIEASRDGVTIDVGVRRYQADVAVMAVGCWSRRLRVRNVAALAVRPVRGQLLQLNWVAPNRPRRIVWGPRCYTVPWSDGTLLVGATLEDAGFNENATVSGVQALAAAASELLPDASVAELAFIRVGLRPALPDGFPAIGPIARAPRVVVATGHYRNGVLLAPLTAEVVSRYVLDGIQDAMFSVCSPDRFLA